MITTFSGSQTLAVGPNCLRKMPIVPGPQTSWVIRMSTSTQILSPGATVLRSACRASTCSVIVMLKRPTPLRGMRSVQRARDLILADETPKVQGSPNTTLPLKLTRRTTFGYRYRMDVSPQSGFGDNLEPIRIPSVIPVFPLPNVVFFPRTYLPLHIFETRYRRMVRDAAASHQMIGMVLLKEGWETDYEGTPATFLKQPLDDEALVQNLSFTMDFTPLEKQFLLEADSLVQQARRLLDLLQFKRYELNEPTGGGWG